jgi:hypothetical protein
VALNCCPFLILPHVGTVFKNIFAAPESRRPSAVGPFFLHGLASGLCQPLAPAI